MVEFDLEWAANANWSQRKNDFLVVDSDPDSDAPAVPRDILLRDPDSDGVSFRATLNNQLVLTNGASVVTINARGGTTKSEVLSISGGPSIITPQARSTGLLTGGEIVAGGVPASEFTVGAGTGVIWDGTTDPATPTVTPTITWTEFTDETTIGVETFVYITSAAALNLSASKTPALDRSHIFLGVVLDSGTSLTIINAPITANQMGSYLSDLYAEIAIMINDVVITPNANLTVANSAGTAFGQSINWHTDRTTPNEITIAANDPMPMTYVTQDGDFAASTVTNMDVANYNPTGGTISAIGGGTRNSTNQRIYITPFGFATLYGQNIFSSLDAAVDGADTENPVVPEWLLNYGTLLVTVSVIRTATDLSDDTEAKFNYSAAGGSAGDNHDHSRLDSPDGLIVPVVQTDNNARVTINTATALAQLDIDQSEAAAVIPVLKLDQGDASEPAILISGDGADQDIVLLKVDVTADPTIIWDESDSAFVFDQDIRVLGAGGVAFFGDGTGNASTIINGAAGSVRDMIYQSNASNRWLFRVDNSAESGGDAGSNFRIDSRSDAGGALISPALMIRRSTGRVGVRVANPLAQLHVDQPSTTAAIPVLTLDQADASEEYINFIAAATGAGNPIDTATAVGTAYARARVAVNGTFKYLQLYNA